MVLQIFLQQLRILACTVGTSSDRNNGGSQWGLVTIPQGESLCPQESSPVEEDLRALLPLTVRNQWSRCLGNCSPEQLETDRGAEKERHAWRDVPLAELTAFLADQCSSRGELRPAGLYIREDEAFLHESETKK